HHATVHIERLSGDVVCRWRREDDHRLSDIFRLAHAGNGQPPNAIVEAAGHLRLDWAWAHRVAIDPVVSPRLRDPLREGQHPAFRCRIGRAGPTTQRLSGIGWFRDRATNFARDRRDIDDFPVALLL